MDYIQELMSFTRIYVQPEEIEALGQVRATELATKRDVLAAEQLRLDCEGVT